MFEQIKMIYQLFYYVYLLFRFFIDVLWIIRDVATIGIPWATLLFFFTWYFSKLFKLSPPDKDKTNRILGSDPSKSKSGVIWAFAKGSACFDVPGNTLTAIKQCLLKGCNTIQLDIGITSDGVLVLCNESLMPQIKKQTAEQIKNINVSQNHPLSNKYPNETIPTLKEALDLLSSRSDKIRLLLNIGRGRYNISTRLLEMLKIYDEIKNNTILVFNSPYAIYKIRRMDPSVICILWLKSPSIITGFAGSLLYGVTRELIVPLLGIPAVIIHKDLLSVNEVARWQKLGIRPYGFPVNSPNTKRYYQLVLNTAYLTESIRTEPPLKNSQISAQ